MSKKVKPTGHRVNVRALAEFALEGGSLSSGGAPERLLEGLRGHQMLQGKYGPERQSEVPVRLTRTVDGVTLILFGRIDGLWREGDTYVVEEIKTTYRPIRELGEDDYPAYWAQAHIYALMVLVGEGGARAAVKLTYLNLDGGQVTFRREYSRAALEDLFLSYARPYAAWITRVEAWYSASRPTFKALGFPFDAYRAGQREMAAQVYVAMREGKKLILEAPTGIGKTAGLIFPAIKAMGEGLIDRAFYLTARTTGRSAAEDAIERMRARGLLVRAVSLTARERICVREDGACDIDTCPRAIGYYDRRREALVEALTMTDFTQKGVEALAEKHRLCPFELSLDLSEIADVVICDYNYVFDPRVRLKRFFLMRTDSALLIDEAHHLPGRARDMLSASLDMRAFRALRRAVSQSSGRGHPLYGCLGAVIAAFKEVRTWGDEPEARLEPPVVISEAVQVFRAVAEEHLGVPAPWGDALADLYFEALDYLRAEEAFSDDYRALIMPEDKGLVVKLWCADAAAHIRASMKRVKSSIMFSATLSPMDFYRDLLGVEPDKGDALASFPSPFPPEHLLVMRAPTETRFSQRERSAHEVAGMIAAVVEAHAGNYLICFPSYAYMRLVQSAFLARGGDVRVIAQRPGMNEAERAAFMAEFEPAPERSMAAFVTMGGVFSEGIDLAGERLSGAVVVGVGLPQLSLENDTLSEIYQDRFDAGFQYAYVYPGFTRVLQAAGRVIRSERDRGVVMLIDARWGDPGYRALFPVHWRVYKVADERAARRMAQAFFGGR